MCVFKSTRCTHKVHELNTPHTHTHSTHTRTHTGAPLQRANLAVHSLAEAFIILICLFTHVLLIYLSQVWGGSSVARDFVSAVSMCLHSSAQQALKSYCFVFWGACTACTSSTPAVQTYIHTQTHLVSMHDACVCMCVCENVQHIHMLCERERQIEGMEYNIHNARTHTHTKTHTHRVFACDALSWLSSRRRPVWRGQHGRGGGGDISSCRAPWTGGQCERDATPKRSSPGASAC
jgi:hypothetical protein